jgi:hypothetical protein
METIWVSSDRFRKLSFLFGILPSVMNSVSSKENVKSELNFIEKYETSFIIFPKIKIYLTVYSLELFETFMDLIYVFSPIITIDTYIHNLHENLMTRKTLIMLTMPSSRSTIRMQMSCHYAHFDSIVISY